MWVMAQGRLTGARLARELWFLYIVVCFCLLLYISFLFVCLLVLPYGEIKVYIVMTGGGGLVLVYT